MFVSVTLSICINHHIPLSRHIITNYSHMCSKLPTPAEPFSNRTQSFHVRQQGSWVECGCSVSKAERRGVARFGRIDGFEGLREKQHDRRESETAAYCSVRHIRRNLYSNHTCPMILSGNRVKLS